jgi:hypothetical protein
VDIIADSAKGGNRFLQPKSTPVLEQIPSLAIGSNQPSLHDTMINNKIRRNKRDKPFGDQKATPGKNCRCRLHIKE